jgi:hypothetical protein
VEPAFPDVPRTAQGHFRLNFYAAVYRLLNHVRRLAGASGDELGRTIERYPFLAGYGAEMRRCLPAQLTWDGALDWWEREILAWERGTDAHLPLVALADAAEIDFARRLALMLVGLVEEDSRFGSVFARLQEPLGHRRPCLELVSQIMGPRGVGDGTDAWGVCRPLIAAGLIEVVNGEAPRSEWVLRVPSILWDVARGEGEGTTPAWARCHSPGAFPRVDELIFPAEFLARAAQVAPLVRAGKADAIVLRGTPGSERLAVMGALARALERGVIEVVDLAAVERPPAALGPLCVMTRSLPVLTYDLAPGETVEVPAVAGYAGPIGVLTGLEGGLGGRAAERAVTLTLPPPKAALRRRYWEAALAGRPVPDLAEISERFHLPGRYIRQVATLAVGRAALDGREAVTIGDVREACRALNRQLLDTLATHLEVEGSWDRLVVSRVTAAKLAELERRCRYRERLLEHLGAGFGSGATGGVRALLTGASGTGKTLAAKILAAQLGMDLYRVDLAAVVNKYIGETEKNLHRVLSRAEELDVILLLDEGDALLSARTEVRSANDRYANLETNYLLQRLETYHGIVVVTTNAGENIDGAFQRRMDVVVGFVPPQAQERWHIWQLHLPAPHAVEPAWLEQVAVRCAMTGAQIRNAALHAILLALDEPGGRVGRRHLEDAVRSEYRKAGATCPLDEARRADGGAGGMETFVSSLSA